MHLNSCSKEKVILLLLLFISGKYLIGQISQIPKDIDTVHFHLSPKEKHVVVKGVSLGWTIHPYSAYTDTVFVKLNGLNIEFGPFGLIGGIYGTVFGLLGTKDRGGNNTNFFSELHFLDSLDYVKYGTHVNGVSISLGGITETYNKGLFINGLACLSYETKGFQISGLINGSRKLKGISMAGIANVAEKANGVQIALINNCGTGNVLQIGLINRIGKRVVPFINFRFKKERKNKIGNSSLN